MKKKFVCCSVLLLFALSFVNVANADTLDITSSMPRSAGVSLDDNGKIISVTDHKLLDTGSPLARTAINYKRARWVYYVETFPNTAWGNKRSTSNFNHYDYWHSSTAKVGSKQSTGTNTANKYSLASVTGSSNYTAEAYYNY